MYKVGMIGLGFMGGCLAKTLVKSPKIESILALDNNKESLIQAKKENVITDFTNNIEDFKDCDIIFICTPVGYIKEYAIKLKDIVKKDCVITDIGSTKKEIVKELEKLDINFIGGHPMVGSERIGYNTSNDYLYESTYYIIMKNNNKKAINLLKEIIKELKAIPIMIDKEKHNYIVAAISHVPHIIASSLVNLVKDLDDEKENMKTLAAGGFKDITRIASSSPTIWQHICQENKEEIIPILEKYIESLTTIKNNMENPDAIYELFASSKAYRDSFIKKKINGEMLATLNIVIKDQSGTVAKVTNILANENINIKNIGIVNNKENMYGSLSIMFDSLEEQEKAYAILKQNNYHVEKVK